MPIARREQIREVLVRVLDELEEETPNFDPFIAELRRRLFGPADVGTGAEAEEGEDETRV